MKVLVIGLGSIARKHIKAIRQIESSAVIFALRSSENAESIDGVIPLFSWDNIPSDLDFVIISNPTALHFRSIKQALSLGAPLFVEKPAFMDTVGVDELLGEVERKSILTYTACNLRFHPLLIWIKANISGKRVFEVQAYCGSYLPDWRPASDYRQTYSADSILGGGVHLDLIHELDYLMWMFGTPQEVFSQKRKISALEISSPDVAFYCLKYPGMIACIMLNYYRRDSRRTLEIVFEDESWTVDLLKGTVVNAKGELLFETSATIADTYTFQMNYFLSCIQKKEAMMNDLAESFETLKISLS